MIALRNSFIYLGTEIINKIIPFLLLPIITKSLTPLEYGIYGMYQVLLSFFVPFMSMNLQANITRNFFKVSKEELSKILSSILIILHINVFIGLLVIFFLSFIFNNPFGIENRILLIMPLIIYAQTINIFNLTILRNEEKALAYGRIKIIIAFVNFLSILLLLFVYHYGWKSLVYGMLLAQVSILGHSFIFFKKTFNLKLLYFDSNLVKKIYRISIPLIFHVLGASIIFLSDRIFIQQIEGLEKVGIYSIGNQFGMIVMIVINAIMMAINPWIYKSLAQGINIYKKLYILMLGFSILGVLIWFISSRIFPYIIDKSYLEAKSIIFWITLAFVFRGWYQLFYSVIIHYGKTDIFIYITFGSALLNIILNYFLIHYNGINGAAQATVIAFFSMYVFTFIYAKFLSNGKKNI